MKLSVIIPLLNEEDNVVELHARLQRVLARWDGGAEVIFVDDGSTDRTLERLLAIPAGDPWMRVVKLRLNAGQTAAMRAGIDLARGEVIVTMDGDLQNDPDDIPMLVEKLHSGYDLVAGWRRHRKDPLLTRNLPSWIANWIIARVTGFHVHDNGCSLKAYRASIIRRVPLYSELHRFIPALVAGAGGRIAEVVVRHHSRQHGTSKYGLSRVGKVLLDMLTVKMVIAFAQRPLHWFGLLAIPWALLFATSAAWTAAAGPRLWGEGGSVSISLALLSGYMALHLIGVGLLAELLVKTRRTRDAGAL
ncbi:MAG TPA: glycosyltransferase family 2 protein [Planctomycetota bacterium]|nr:glycosyltransferase family 2 protein [Planctomycetota bacterium]